MEGFDVLISEDEHDVDVITVKPAGSPLRLRQYVRADGVRVDVIEVPEDLGEYDALEDSFQPTAWFIATEGQPVTEKGLSLIGRLRGRIDPRVYAAHLRAVSLCFLEGEDWCPGIISKKSWRVRRGVSQPSKQAVPVYRIACDLLPKALYTEDTGRLPTGRTQALQRYPELMVACGLALKGLRGEADVEDLERAAETARRYLLQRFKVGDVEIMRMVIGMMRSRGYPERKAV